MISEDNERFYTQTCSHKNLFQEVIRNKLQLFGHVVRMTVVTSHRWI